MYISQDSAISFLAIYPQDSPSYHKYTCTVMFIEVLSIITRNQKKKPYLFLAED